MQQKPNSEPYESAVLEVFRMNSDVIVTSGCGDCSCDDAYGCGDCAMHCDN